MLKNRLDTAEKIITKLRKRLKETLQNETQKDEDLKIHVRVTKRGLCGAPRGRKQTKKMKQK